jgi:hypothetical protein
VRTSTAKGDVADGGTGAADSRLVTRHLAVGWWSLLVFLTAGLALEALHGLKIDWYLGVSKETRRLMWTLSHAHGTLLALVHVGFASTLRVRPMTGSAARVASRCLLGAGFVLPGGFFLGGLFIHDGDPGLGVLLVPVGAALLFASVLLVAREVTRGAKRAVAPEDRPPKGRRR